VSVRRLTVAGLGLIGGSVALAARRADADVAIRAVDEDPDTLSFALREGVADEALSTTDAAEAGWFGPGAADLVVLATPVPVTVRLLASLGRLGYDGIVTDVASTRAPWWSPRAARSKTARDTGSWAGTRWRVPSAAG